MEYWDIYDKDGNFTGKIIEKGTAFLPGEYHKDVEIWIINKDGNLLLQKRSDAVELYPGRWALTTGRLKSGETPLEGCVRELLEELGILASQSSFHHLAHIVREDAAMLWDIFITEWNGNINDLSYADHEVSDAKWVTPEELLTLIRSETIFTYPEIETILQQIQKYYRKPSGKNTAGIYR